MRAFRFRDGTQVNVDNSGKSTVWKKHLVVTLSNPNLVGLVDNEDDYKGLPTYMLGVCEMLVQKQVRPLGDSIQVRPAFMTIVGFHGLHWLPEVQMNGVPYIRVWKNTDHQMMREVFKAYLATIDPSKLVLGQKAEELHKLLGTDIREE